MIALENGGMRYRPPKQHKRPYLARVRDAQEGVRRDEHQDSVLCAATTKKGNPCRGLAAVDDPDGFCPGHIKQREARRGRS